MATIHFFTNPTLLQAQSAGQKYGPVQGSETSQYRVTSGFSASAPVKAYAVCNGKIFAQEVNGNINIVLRPTQQPTGICAPVKYYIYKGLMKDSLVAGNDLIAAATKSDLTALIRKSQELRNKAYDELKDQAQGTTTTLATINSVGLHLTALAVAPDKLLDTAFIDDVFLRVDEDEFPTVKGGDDIGEFDHTNLGFEIILDGLGEGPTLKALRNTETIISITTAPANDVGKFKEEDKREQILNYIDPCAFYASFFFAGIRVKPTPSSAKFVSKDKDGLYNEVLSKFLTKNVVYLDLRNEHNHGFNYYRNYNVPPNDYALFYISYDGSGSVHSTYQSHGWPIFTIPTSAFTGLNNKKPSTVSLKLPQGDNTAPGIYRAQGYFFAGFKRIGQPPDIKEVLRTNLGFQADSLNVPYTVPVAFSIPKLANNTTVPAYINVRYLKRVGAAPPPNPPVGNLTLKAEHFLDNLFELTYLLNADGLEIPLDTDEVTQWHVTGSTSVVDSSSNYGRDYVAKIGIGRDQSNVYFFACAESANMITGSTAKTGLLPVLAKAHKSSIKFGYIKIPDANNVNQPILMHDGLPDGLLDSPPSSSSLNVDERSIVVLALDKDELPDILNAVGSLEPAFDKRLALRNKQNYLDSAGSVTATEYELFVIGYKFGSGVSPMAVNTHIKIRNKRLLPRIFSSKAAALNSEGLSGVNQNMRHFTRSRMQLDVDWGIRSIHQAIDDAKVASSKGVQWEFTILGKKRVFDSDEGKDFDWFYVESRQDIPARLSQILPKGSRRWIRANQDRFYPVASFEKFITDLISLNKDLDDFQLQSGAPLDTLSERITRLRQMTKESAEPGGSVSLSKLFDEIIGSSAPFPPLVQRLNEIDYVAGAPETIFDAHFDMNHTLDTEIQLFRDYMGVEFGSAGNGVIIDLHHLFVGMDVLFHADPDKYINPFIMLTNGLLDNLPQFFSLGSNVDLATWAGDIGAAAADYVSLVDTDYRNSLDPKLTQAQKETALREHFYKTRAKDDDLYPDLYVHLLHEQLLHRLQREASFRNLAAALYHFNLQLIGEGDKAAFAQFVAYLKFDPTIPFRDQPDVISDVQAKIIAFADFWWIKNNPGSATIAYTSGNPLIPSQMHQIMLPFAQLYADNFLRWLEPRK